MSAIGILWLRQLKRYSRSRSRVIGSMGQPLLFLLGLGFGFGPIFARAGAGNYIQFVAPGIVAMGVLFTAVFSGIEIIWDRQFGFLKETLVAPVPRLHIVLGRTLGGATVASIQGLIVFAVCTIVGFRFSDARYFPIALAFMFLIALLFTSIGTAIASVVEDMQGFPLIMNFMVMPLFFFSSALYPLTNLPRPLQTIIRLNPLTYGVDGIRGSASGTFQFGIGTDFVVLGALTLVLVAIGSYLFSRIEV